MQIKEVLKTTGLSKRTVHYYIQQQIINPKRVENGYYDFSKKDIQTLKIVRQLRFLNLSIEEIRSILNNPTTAFYYFVKQKKEVQQQAILSDWKLSCFSELLTNLDTDITIGELSDYLDIYMAHYPSKSNTNLIDMDDAEMLAYYFWGRFAGHSSMSEYQRFLWEKLKKSIILYQTDQTRALRDIIYNFSHERFLSEFFPNLKLYTEVAALSESDYPEYVNILIQKLEHNLKDSEHLTNLRKIYDYAELSAYFFDSEPSMIMSEISPFFQKFKYNINNCGRMIYNYLKSEDGISIRVSIEEKFPDIDISINHNAALIGFCL